MHRQNNGAQGLPSCCCWWTADPGMCTHHRQGQFPKSAVQAVKRQIGSRLRSDSISKMSSLSDVNLNTQHTHRGWSATGLAVVFCPYDWKLSCGTKALRMEVLAEQRETDVREVQYRGHPSITRNGWVVYRTACDVRPARVIAWHRMMGACVHS